MPSRVAVALGVVAALLLGGCSADGPERALVPALTIPEGVTPLADNVLGCPVYDSADLDHGLPEAPSTMTDPACAELAVLEVVCGGTEWFRRDRHVWAADDGPGVWTAYRHKVTRAELTVRRRRDGSLFFCTDKALAAYIPQPDWVQLTALNGPQGQEVLAAGFATEDPSAGDASP